MLSEFICPNCGSPEWEALGPSHFVCKFCKHPAPTRVMGNQESLDFEQASSVLRISDFEEAETRFVDFVTRYPYNAAGYWGLVLSRYKVHYEEENGRKIPTCHDMVNRRITTDPDFSKAVELADPLTKPFYQLQGQIIEKLQNEYEEILKKEPPYDIFISYKDTENGVRTQDSRDANDLYLYLKSKGYRVFYSRESLKHYAGYNYEPPIYNAIKTAKVMILYGSKVDYFRSPWIKNEWQRFHKRIQQKEKQPNALIVTFSRLDPYQLPNPLGQMQCLNWDEKTFYENLLAIISSILEKEELLGRGLTKVRIDSQGPKKKQTPAPILRGLGTSTPLPMSENAKFSMAISYFKQQMVEKSQRILAEVLLENPHHAEALLLSFLIDGKLTEIKEIPQGAWIQSIGSMHRIEELLAILPSAKSLELLQMFYQASRKLWQESHPRALDLSKILMAYESEERLSYLNDLMSHALTNLSDPLFDALFDRYDDKEIDRVLEFLDNYIENLLKKNEFIRADTYFSKLIDIDSGYYAHNSRTPRLSHFSTYIENSLGGQKDRAPAVKLFQKIVPYTDEPEAIKTHFNKMVFRLLELKEFALALPIFPLLVGLGEAQAKVYLGWLQAKLNCQTPFDLIYQSKNLEEQPEYPMIFAGNDSKISDLVVLLAKEQEHYRQFQQAFAQVLKENPTSMMIQHGSVIKYNAPMFGFMKGRTNLGALAIPPGAIEIAGSFWKELPPLETLYIPKSIRIIHLPTEKIQVKNLVVEGSSSLFYSIAHEVRSWMIPQLGLGSSVKLSPLNYESNTILPGLVIQFLEKGCRLLDLRSMFNLGLCYLFGYGVPQNTLTALEWFQRTQKEDEVLGMAGNLLVTMIQTKPESRTLESLQPLMTKATNNAFVSYFIGKMISRYLSILDNQAMEATNWLRRASQLGSREARLALGSLYVRGFYGKSTVTEIFNEMLNLANLQNPQGSEGFVGYCYLTGKAGTKDLKKASDYLNAAIKNNDIEGHFGLGILSLGSENQPRQVEVALAHLQKAALQGHIEAQRTLGSIYQSGQLVPQNLKAAFEWFLQAAQQGHLGAQNSVGTFYFAGRGIPKDPQKAFEWFTLAASKGHDIAQYNLANCYENGIGTPRDSAMALKYYLSSAEQGNPQAQFMMGEFYLVGKRVPLKYAVAVDWYTKSAQSNYSPAMIRLGECYHLGYGVPINLSTEFSWYYKAAQQNDPEGCYKVALGYQYGQGVPKDLSLAKQFAQKAMAMNFPGAHELFHKL